MPPKRRTPGSQSKSGTPVLGVGDDLTVHPSQLVPDFVHPQPIWCRINPENSTNQGWVPF